MWKKLWKKYGKIVAAAVFLTVAGLCYGFAGSRDETVKLDASGSSVSEKEEADSNWMILGRGSEERTEPADGDLEMVETEAEIPKCFVHICGEVKAPGVYELAEGSRIFEAVEAAGGFTEEASEASLNLAGVISDGMQIVILSKEEVRLQLEAAGDPGAGLVNINKASKAQLMTLPGIGESRAEDIIRYREESGGFQTIEDIMKVSGIKDAAFQKIKDSITV